MGVAAFQVHRGHPFEGFCIESGTRGAEIVEARCECGAILCVADAVYSSCPECSGGPLQPICRRCGSTGLVLDHAALEWRLAEENGG